MDCRKIASKVKGLNQSARTTYRRTQRGVTLPLTDINESIEFKIMAFGIVIQRRADDFRIPGALNFCPGAKRGKIS